MNRFIELIKNNRIFDLGDLKSVYRLLIKKTHPDIVGSDIFIEDFKEIKKEYEEAAIYITNSEFKNIIQPKTSVNDNFDRQLFYLELQGIFARGFPELPRLKKAKEIYLKSRGVIIKELSLWNVSYKKLFQEFETNLCEISKTKGKNHETKVIFLTIYNIIYYQFQEGYHKNVAIKSYETLHKYFKISLDTPLMQFIGILVDDLKNPAAFKK